MYVNYVFQVLLNTQRMALRLFGFQIGKERRDKTQGRRSFVPPELQDGSMVTETGTIGTVMDLDGTIRNETELITRYRDMSNQPEIDAAISHIINEAISVEENKSSVSIVLDNLDYSEEIKETIRREFDNVMNMLNFNNECQKIFRRWYVDGRLFYHILIDNKNPRDGIQELRYIDPRNIHKVTNIERALTKSNIEVITDMSEYYVYNEMGIDYAVGNQGGAIIAPDAVAYCHSGVMDHNSKNSIVLSHLHKAIKPMNQLRMMEDATVIYRMSRAPERRAFYIDVGNLPKTKAEQYLRDIMNQYRNKIVYDAVTGEIRDDKKFLSMMEDYWLPRRDGNRGTEIQTLQGGANLSELADVEFFQMKLYQALNVPLSRLKPDTGFSLGRSAEITRDEVTFFKFVRRLRNDFTVLLDILLSRQLMLKGVISFEDWHYIRQRIFYDFLQDTYFTELKDMEMIQSRFQLAQLLGVTEFVGNYVSNQWVRQNVLKQTEDEMDREDKQIALEQSKGEGGAPDAMDAEGMEGGDQFGGEDEGGGGVESGDEIDDHFNPQERQILHTVAKQAGVDPDHIMDTLTAAISGAGGDEEEEPEPDDDEQPEEKEEDEEEKPEQKESRKFSDSKQFRSQLRKLWTT